MAGFPILDLNPTHLEKVINKLQEKSYFRLQQTCRDVMEFIHNSKKISVCLDYTSLTIRDSGHFQLDDSSRLYTGHDIQSLYGTRVPALYLSSDTNWEFSILYDALKTYRITCRRVHIFDGQWTAKQYAKLFNLLNDSFVHIVGHQPEPFEALFEAKALRGVHMLQVDSALALELVERLLPSFRRVSIAVTKREENQAQPFYSILQILCSKDFPKLRSFQYHAYWSIDALSYKKEIEKALSDLDLIVKFEERSPDVPQNYDPDNYFWSTNEKIYTIEKPTRDSRTCRIVCRLVDDGDFNSSIRRNSVYCTYTAE